MPVIVLASSSVKPSCSSSWERFQKRVEERRAVIESARAMNVKRLQNDLQRIAKKEVEFAQKMLEEIVPVKVSWNQDAWTKLQESLPVRVEPLHSTDADDAVVVKDEKKNTNDM